MVRVTELSENCLSAYDYACRVSIGDIPACALTMAAIDRFFNDLARQDTEDFPYYMDWSAAERVMTFVQKLPHIKGPQAGNNIRLEPWQRFLYLNIYGWRHKVTHFRRFRKVYTEVPRGNGKSTMVAPACLYMLAADAEGGAEVYSAATSRDQARIVFNAAKGMASRRKLFVDAAGVDVSKYLIEQEKTNSTFVALSADASTLDGLNVHMAVLDELARHKNREVHDIIETATGKRNQPLMWMITTAGPDQNGIGFEIHDYAKKVLQGVFVDEAFFAVIYTIDEEDDWTKEESWIKANPNWGVSVFPDTITQLASRAVQVTSFQNSFKMKHLNVWTNASVGWMDGNVWARQATDIDLSQFRGNECMMALDLASKVDIAALVLLFRKPNQLGGSSRHPYTYYLYPKLYLPHGAVLSNRNASYEGWGISGHLTITPGDVIDFELIEEDIHKFTELFDVKDIAYDPWQATQLAQRMSTAGAPMMEFPATVRNFSEPTKELESYVRQGIFFHNNNPCFNWMVSNLVILEDRKGNIFPRKERDSNKIDGPVAAIMALARWMFMEHEVVADVEAMIG